MRPRLKHLLYFLLLLQASLTQAQNRQRIDSLNTLIPTLKEDTAKVYAIQALAEEYFGSDNSKAIALGQKGLALSHKIKSDYCIAFSYSVIGVAYDYSSNYDSAFYYYSKSLRIKEKINDKSGITATLMNMGTLFYFQNKFDQALSYYNQALQRWTEAKDSMNMARVYNNIGAIYRKQKLYDKAIDTYQQSLNIKLRTNDIKSISSSYLNIGIAWQFKGNLEKAVYYMEEAYTIDSVTGNKNDMSATLVSLTDLYLEMNKVAEAKKALNKALQLAQETGDPFMNMNTYAAYVKLDTLLHQYPAAVQHLQQYIYYSNVYSNKEKDDQLYKWQTIYETEKKENRIVQLEIQGQYEKKTRWIIVISGALLVIMLILIINRLVVSRRRQKIIFEQQQQLAHARQQLTQSELNATRNELEAQKAALDQYTQSLISKNEQVEQMRGQMEDWKKTLEQQAQQILAIPPAGQLTEMAILTEDDWERFKTLFNKVHQGFFMRLKEKYPDLTQGEIRLCALTRLKLSSKEMGQILGISATSVNTTRYRLRKKLNLSEEDDFEQLILAV